MSTALALICVGLALRIIVYVLALIRAEDED